MDATPAGPDTRETVHVVNVTTKHGVNVSVHRTHEGAVRCAAEYAREWWDEARGIDPELPADPPADDEDAIDQYFGVMGDRLDGEHLDIEAVPLND